MAKKKGKNCKIEIQDSCLSQTYAKCVRYEGEFSEHTNLDVDGCYSIEDVAEDLYELIDEIKDATDVSGLGCCIEYEASDEEVGLVVKDVLSTHESMLCDHEDRISKLESGDTSGGNCTNAKDECGNTVNCCDILKKYAFGVGISQTTNVKGEWNTFANPAYSDLFYKLEIKGTYKISFECNAVIDLGSSIKVGLSINNADPLNNPFNQVEMMSHSGELQHMSCSFIFEGLKGDTISFKFDGNGGSDSEIHMAKMIVEKIK